MPAVPVPPTGSGGPLEALEGALPWLPSPLALVLELPGGSGPIAGPDWFHEGPAHAERRVEVVLSAGATRLGTELVGGGSWLVQRAADCVLDQVAEPQDVLGVDGSSRRIRCVARPVEGGAVVDFVEEPVEPCAEERREQLLRIDALEKVIEALPVALFIKDPRDGYRFKRVNRCFEETFGLRREDVVGHCDDELASEELCETYRAVDEAVFREARIIRVEEEIETPVGPRIGHTIKLPLFDEDGKPELLVGILQDVTDFRRATGEAEEAKALKARLLHGLGSGARSALTSLVERLDESLLAVTMQERHVESSIEEARRIARDLELQIAEVLDASHVACGSRAVNWSSFDPAEVAARSMANARRAAAKEGVELELVDHRAAAVAGMSSALTVEGDPERLGLALGQLLSNAIKFTRGGGKVRLILEQPTPVRRVRISVVDEGIGIPEDELAVLFDGGRAGLGHGAGSPSEGAGLGLAIARQLVEAMDGTLTVESESGVGSRFHIDLAALGLERSRSLSTSGQDPAPDRGSRRVTPVSEAMVGALRVLVADDSSAHRRILRRHLEAHGHLVTATGRVEEVLAVLHSPTETVDLILVDLRMPGVDCFDLIASVADWARALPGTHAAPRIIAMSSFARGTTEASQEERQAIDAGAERCLFKPLAAADLASCTGKATA